MVMITSVSRIHAVGTMDVCIKRHLYPSSNTGFYISHNAVNGILLLDPSCLKTCMSFKHYTSSSKFCSKCVVSKTNPRYSNTQNYRDNVHKLTQKLVNKCSYRGLFPLTSSDARRNSINWQPTTVSCLALGCSSSRPPYSLLLGL